MCKVLRLNHELKHAIEREMELLIMLNKIRDRYPWVYDECVVNQKEDK